ncbi:hypothetical protein ACVWWO_006400 [Bradyrhizobium sp. F1.13.1]
MAPRSARRVGDFRQQKRVSSGLSIGADWDPLSASKPVERRLTQNSYSLPLAKRGRVPIALLEADSVDPCPRPIFEKVLATAGGHPLSLALINAAVANGTSWGDIAIDCEEIGKFTDGDTRLYDRILGRHRSNLEGELAVFAWVDQPICDIGFLRYAIRPVGARNVQSNAVTAVDRTSVIRLHEIVFAAFRRGGWCSEAGAAELGDALELYIASLSRGDTHSPLSRRVSL